MTDASPALSVHFERRWYYALWATLLALSLGAWFLWERPVRTELAACSVVVRIADAPPGSRIEAWAGPWASWPGAAWNGAGAYASAPLKAGERLELPALAVPIGRRRWSGYDYVPRRTWDLVMLRITPGEGPPRYLAMPLSSDIRQGLLRPKHRLITAIETSWKNLGVDGRAPVRIP